jgi:hypothetical protein
MTKVVMQVELPAKLARQLALFVKRVRHDQCRELTECWQSGTERDDQAYAMLEALELLGRALAEKSFAPL